MTEGGGRIHPTLHSGARGVCRAGPALTATLPADPGDALGRQRTRSFPRVTIGQGLRKVAGDSLRCGSG